MNPVLTASVSAPGGASALQPGARVGPYVVIQRIGRGGMGEVFRARDGRLDREVALKCVLAPGPRSVDLHDRVVREGRVAARIAHANVAIIHDVLAHEGRTFIVMEYVEGESLAAVLRRGRLPLNRVLDFACQIAGALVAAHKAGVIHRDLKPGNIQITPANTVKILDFGISIAYAALPSATTQTAPGSLTDAPQPGAGTPGYMPPEQAMGAFVDERSDIFSLAVVLFEMIAGRRPADAEDPREALRASAAYPARLGASGRRLLNELADIAATGLAPDPQDRFQSAADMEAALRALQPLAVREAWRRLAMPAGAVAGTLALIWLLGRASSAAFNNTLGRSGPFASESEAAHFVSGLQSLVAPTVYAGLAIVLFWAVRFAVAVLAVWPPAGRLLQVLKGGLRTSVGRLGLQDPLMFAQGLVALGVVAIATVGWRFNDLIRAWSVTLSTGDMTVWRLGPANEGEKVLYRMVVTVLLLAFSAGLLRLLQRRRGHPRSGGRGVMAALIAIVGILLLLDEVPYRLLWKNKAPRVVFNGLPCYVIGEDASRSLLYCPTSDPPRNRIVDKHDSALRQSGIVESIFTPTVR